MYMTEFFMLPITNSMIGYIYFFYLLWKLPFFFILFY